MAESEPCELNTGTTSIIGDSKTKDGKENLDNPILSENLVKLDKRNLENDDEKSDSTAPNMPNLFEKHKLNAVDFKHESFGTLKRSDSLSSLDSEASSIQGGRSSKRRTRKNLKPKIKSKFGDATVQYIKDRLEGQIFSGWLEEKRRLDSVVRTSGSIRDISLSEELAGWRDVIEVDSSEHEMRKQLEAVMNSVPGSSDGKKWINIQSPSLTQGFMLWLILPQTYPVDHYWFKVRSVNVHPVYGLLIHLIVLRALGEKDAESFASRSRRLAATKAASEGDIPQSLTLAWQSVYENVSTKCNWDTAREWITYLLMPSNVAYGLRMSVLTLISIVFGSVALLKEGFRLFMYLLRESGTLIDKATPLVKVILGFFEKIFGGFYILIAMIYRDSKVSNQNPPPAPIGGYSQPPAAIMGAQGPQQAAYRRYVPANSWSDGQGPQY